MTVREKTKQDEKIVRRKDELLKSNHFEICRNTDRWFVKLLIFQWIFGIVLSLIVSPRTWAGQYSQTHIHVWAAIFLGGAIIFFPIVLGVLNPGKVLTRHVIAVGQVLYSALLIHLTGGRIETHFHIFGSLAFIAFYRDWKVFIPVTLVVAADHFIRGVYWPQSVFGVLVASHWRWMEHAAWVIFEDIFLIKSCRESFFQMAKNAENTALLESNNEQLAKRSQELQELTDTLDEKVNERTASLLKANESLSIAHDHLKNTQLQLVQSEKLASIGSLAAGVAHEINNPIGFVGSNIQMLGDYMKSFVKVLEESEKLKKEVEEEKLESAKKTVAEIRLVEQENNIEYLVADINNLIIESRDGLDRVKRIVLDLKTFSRDDNGEMQSVQTEEIIESVLGIVQNEIKYKADVKRVYGQTPRIECLPQKLGQVFINLLMNAGQSIEENGTITIRTYVDHQQVAVEIEDTGKGIPEEHIHKIFDPFYTTKPVGQGTGLGLSISHEIVAKHGGEMLVESEVGKGTRFTVKLPLVHNSPS
ncbi:MAG: ATP-binding protein [Candidatus Omnitrophota bacterium]